MKGRQQWNTTREWWQLRHNTGQSILNTLKFIGELTHFSVLDLEGATEDPGTISFWKTFLCVFVHVSVNCQIIYLDDFQGYQSLYLEWEAMSANHIPSSPIRNELLHKGWSAAQLTVMHTRY